MKVKGYGKTDYKEAGGFAVVVKCPDCGQGGTFDTIPSCPDKQTGDNNYLFGQRICPNPDCNRSEKGPPERSVVLRENDPTAGIAGTNWPHQPGEGQVYHSFENEPPYQDGDRRPINYVIPENRSLPPVKAPVPLHAPGWMSEPVSFS